MNVQSRPRLPAAVTSMRVSGVGSAMPAHRFAQPAIATALKDFWGERLRKPELLDQVHEHSRVDFRHLSFPFERYMQFSTWGRPTTPGWKWPRNWASGRSTRRCCRPG
jgi:hypothetical protein